MGGARFLALDAWRGIAALMVAVFHLEAYGHHYDWAIVRNGFLFVDFFFVLSGFVIAHAYADRLNGAADAWRFILRRFGRLWPLHVATLAAFVVLVGAEQLAHRLVPALGPSEPLEGRWALDALWSNLLMVHAIGVETAPTWNDPSWSISVEFFAYLTFAAAALLFGRGLFWAAFPITLGAMAILILNDPHQANWYQWAFVRGLGGFFAGVIVHGLFARGVRLPARAGTGAEWAALALAVGFVAFAEGPVQHLAPVAFGLVIWVFARESGPLSQAMRAPFLQKCGDWSYSIYMTHMLLIFLIEKGFRALEKLTGAAAFRQLDVTDPNSVVIDFFGRWGMDLVTLLYLAATIALAALTYRFIEQPTRSWFNALADGHGRRTRAASAPG
jgi:peptidoglycan/LPS O-acetylase OafA/YrhL